MSSRNVLVALVLFAAPALLVADGSGYQEVLVGERVDPATYGPGVVESMDEVLARQRLLPPRPSRKVRNGAQGVWAVPGKRATSFPRSGVHYATNKWGDTRMGIGFPEVVDVHGAYFAGQSGQKVWTTGIRVVGYRAGEVVRSTDWFRGIGEKPKWLVMDLRGVDRIVIEAEPVLDGAGWYGMDDLAFSPHGLADMRAEDVTVIDFEDLPYRKMLTGTGYAGLVWETGTGDFQQTKVLPPPARTEVEQATEGDEPSLRGDEPPLRDATAPTLQLDFGAQIMGEGVSYMAIPPDTIGAIGIDEYVEVVNDSFSIFGRDGARWARTSLEEFFPEATGTVGDPRVLFDQHSQRWIVIATDFDSKIFLAVSKTSNPAWPGFYKTSFVASQGTDAPYAPDYPTLGVDAEGIYITCYMVGRGRQTVFALDKAPLIADPQSLGTITAWRGIWDDIIQPAHTYGDSGGEYMVSRSSSSALKIRQVVGSLSGTPSLSTLGTAAVPYGGTPPDAPALGSTTDLDTGGTRLWMSMYRDGSLWTCNSVYSNGRSACRWYQLDAAGVSLQQNGLINDGTLYYFYPSIMVNSVGDVVMGFSGSHAGQYAATYYTGRKAADTAGEMAAPVLLKAGESAYNHNDGWGRNRWGDYSYTTLDPTDELTFWSIQEYAASGNLWGTWVAVLDFPGGPTPCPGDANCDGQVDLGDIDPFVAALSGGTPCLFENVDVNGDDEIDLADIDPFVAILSAGEPCP